MSMTMQDAMRKRHMVRKYQDREIPEDTIQKIRERIIENNQEHGLSMKLVLNDPNGLNGIARMMLSKNAKNFIVLAGKDTDDLEERLGYCGADVMLYAQTLGLNSWWIGGTYNRKEARGKDDAEMRTLGILVIGYGINQGKPHQTKTASEISTYDGHEPKWFQEGIEALLLAPTALNRQDFSVRGKGKSVSIQSGGGTFSKIDLGIGKYHFETGAGIENFEWADHV